MGNKKKHYSKEQAHQKVGETKFGYKKVKKDGKFRMVKAK